jgi:hypothetical protein
MTFHYDFVLKTLNQKGGTGMTTLIEDSYWKALLSEELSAGEAAAAAASSQAQEYLVGLGEVLAACEEKDEIDRKIASLQNAKKKAALRELEAWETEHRNWSPHLARHKKYKDACAAAAAASRVCSDILEEASVPTVSLRRMVLEEYGFLEGGTDPLASPGPSLTALGRLASEINEGHPYLMTELFLRIRGSPPSLPDLLTILSVFLGEAREDEARPINQLDTNDVVRDELARIEADSRIGQERERRAGCLDPKFWAISNEWVEPIGHWVASEDPLPVVATVYEVFEGNLQRALMKLMGKITELSSECIGQDSKFRPPRTWATTDQATVKQVKELQVESTPETERGPPPPP